MQCCLLARKCLLFGLVCDIGFWKLKSHSHIHGASSIAYLTLRIVLVFYFVALVIQAGQRKSSHHNFD